VDCDSATLLKVSMKDGATAGLIGIPLTDHLRDRGLDVLERRHWAAILFLIRPPNAL